MPLYPLLLGWLVLAAGPASVGPEPPGIRPAGSASDLSDLARLTRRTDPKVRTEPIVFDGSNTERAEYVVESAARSTQVFLLPPGPRTIRSLEVEMTPAQGDVWREARLRLCWEIDDTETPGAGVDLPLGLAFARTPGLPQFTSLAVAASGNVWVNRFPMPYRTQALLRIDSPLPIAGKIRVRTTRGVSGDAGYYRGAVVPIATSSTNRIEEKGGGHLAGVVLVDEGREGASKPERLGRLVVDGRSVGPLSVALGLPVPDAPGGRSQVGPVSGTLLPDPPAPSVSYRWFVADPIVFERSFAVVAEDGQGDARTRFAAVFWYSERPGWGRVQR